MKNYMAYTGFVRGGMLQNNSHAEKRGLPGKVFSKRKNRRKITRAGN